MMSRILAPLVLSVALAAPAAALEIKSDPRTGAIPSLTAPGEIAINRADGRLFWRMPDGSLGTSTLLNALPSGRRAVEQGQSDDQTVAPNPAAPLNTLSRLLADRQTTTYTPDLGPGIVGAPRSVVEALDAGYLDARALGFRSCLTDCAAARAANDAAAASLSSKLSDVGGTIFFRRGIWPFTQGFNLTDKHFGVVGEGEGRTILRFDGTGNLFNITENSLFYRLEFRSFTAWAASTGANTTIKIVRPLGNSSTQTGPNIRNVEFVPTDPAKYQWQTGIDCLGCWSLNVTENLFVGKDNAFSADFLILRDKSTPPTIINNKVFSANRAVYAPPGAFVEGPIIVANQFVGVNYGIFLDNANNAPGAQIIGNHINAYIAGIVSIARPQVMIAKNLLYRYGSSTTGFDWNGIYLGAASSDASIEDNSFYGYKGQYPGNATAVTGVNSTAGSVFGGMMADLNYGIVGSQNWAVVYDNIKTRNVTTFDYQLGAGSYRGNVWAF
ncbi:hypothetical protein [Methylobacterium indicum]|uniref:hypothetical protein n=1 Tax=Methylobacterium indicum TaxID=1775910 RepID=UPI00079A8544|nr:hypothetical protein [Methylobacterium indicum]KTS39110.1 hypothetical protein NS229_01450 [Methylobacterium indicum]